MPSLTVAVIEARNLYPSDGKTSDPYARVIHSKVKVAKTPAIPKTLNPKWSKEYTLEYDQSSPVLRVEVWDRDKISNDDFLGMVELNLKKYEDGVKIKDWFPLTDKKGKKSSKVSGDIRLKVQLSGVKRSRRSSSGKDRSSSRRSSSSRRDRDRESSRRDRNRDDDERSRSRSRRDRDRFAAPARDEPARSSRSSSRRRSFDDGRSRRRDDRGDSRRRRSYDPRDIDEAELERRVAERERQYQEWKAYENAKSREAQSRARSELEYRRRVRDEDQHRLRLREELLRDEESRRRSGAGNYTHDYDRVDRAYGAVNAGLNNGTSGAPVYVAPDGRRYRIENASPLAQDGGYNGNGRNDNERQLWNEVSRLRDELRQLKSGAGLQGRPSTAPAPQATYLPAATTQYYPTAATSFYQAPTATTYYPASARGFTQVLGTTAGGAYAAAPYQTGRLSTAYAAAPANYVTRRDPTWENNEKNRIRARLAEEDRALRLSLSPAARY